jgi:hypothetical protein
MLDIIASRLWDFITWLYGWRSELPEGALVGINLEDNQPVYVDASLPAEGLLSYVLKDDEESIFVPKGTEKRAAAALDATVEGDTWSFREGDQIVQRKRKTPPVEAFSNQVAIVKWVDWSGFDCITVEATERRPKVLRLYKIVGRDWHGNVKYKMVSKYKVTETGDYCLRVRNQTCRIGFRNVTGEFKERERSGRWKWDTRTRLIGKCAN